VKRDFLKLHDLSSAEHAALFARAAALKAERRAGERHATLAGRTLALVFEKSSTRTRLSFEAAIAQLGGHAIDLPTSTSQIARGEPMADTARVTSRYVDAIVLRTHADARLQEFASAATVPVINGLSDGGHPVQLLADLFTIIERFGSLAERRVAWIGDAASNMGRSWVEAARLFGFELRVAAPVGYQPPENEVAAARGRVMVTTNPSAAVEGADVVTTDVWTSMGQESETAARRAAFQGYLVDEALLRRAAKNAIVLHCLPAHRGEEISEAVLEGPQSAVFDEAENRLHVQKALLEQLLAR
jgi:ornithine carbamoyltransferase